MKLRLLLPLLALPAFAVTGLAQNTESAVQLRRDFTTVQQQRDALSEQVAQLQQQLETLQAEREAVKAEQAAMHEKVAAADTRAVEATEVATLAGTGAGHEERGLQRDRRRHDLRRAVLSRWRP